MSAVQLSPAAREHAADTADSIRIVLDGRDLGPEWVGMLQEAQVRDNMRVPDMAVVRFLDPLGDKMMDSPLKLGRALEVWFGSATEKSPTKVFSGDIVALEPEWGNHGASITVRALDKGYKLNGSRTSQTYMQMTASDIVKRVAGRAGLPIGTVDATGVVHDHLQQSQETDWQLCWRLAQMNGYEFGVDDGKVLFRKHQLRPAATTLKWQENLLSFRARASVVGQVKDVTVNSHDPKAKAQTSGTASTPDARAKSAIWDQRAKAIAAVGAGTAVVADRVATTPGEATAMASAALRRNASTFVEADGLAFGNPKLTAGATVTLQGVADFSGDYVLSSTTHVFKGATGYTTKFEISGDRSRSFSDLVAGGASSGSATTGGDSAGSTWASGLVLAVVTNNNDPEGMGRVKVKFEALGDNMESEWARVTTLNAGGKRGMFMMPQPNDTVVVGFEHGDARRPFVLGSLFNGKDKLDDDLKDASGRLAKFGVKTNHQFLAHSEKELKLHSSEKMTVEVKGSPGTYELDADGTVKTKSSQGFEVEAGSTMKIKATGTVEIESSAQLKLKGSMISVEASGVLELKGSMIKLG
jgi:phage protein D/phage baseplate assembly protein gpV